jgi:hypothetical protein
VAVSRDGMRVLFKDSSELTSGATEGGLYLFDVADGKLSYLPAGGPPSWGSLFGADEEATVFYGDSPAVLTSEPNSQGETAQPGASNTYMLREAPVGSGSWSATYITDQADARGAHPSPNGRYLTFMSSGSPTGYDNRDLNNGRQDVEVYLYSAATNRLVCASCDPTGAKPIGQFDHSTLSKSPPPATPIDSQGEWEGSWLAGLVPGFTYAGYGGSEGGGYNYQPRSLLDSGQLFFDSTGGLVPRDVNGRTDVYEYEPVGVGSCRSPSYGQSASVVFDPAVEACIGLISNGTRGSESIFFDASADGSDVFFTAEDGLVPRDVDNITDMYDARVCTQAEPCVQLPAPSPACMTPDSCRAAPTPEPGVFGSGPTETFAGAGNVVSTPTATLKKSAKRASGCTYGRKLSHHKCVRRKGKVKKGKRAGNNRRAKS